MKIYQSVIGSTRFEPALCRHFQQLECPKEMSKAKDISKPEDGDNIFIRKVGIRSISEVRELTAVKVLHTSLLKTTVATFKALPLASYAPMPAPSPHFKTILELVLWDGLQSCCCITPEVINVIKMPSFHYFLYLREQKKVTGG